MEFRKYTPEQDYPSVSAREFYYLMAVIMLCSIISCSTDQQPLSTPHYTPGAFKTAGTRG